MNLKGYSFELRQGSTPSAVFTIRGAVDGYTIDASITYRKFQDSTWGNMNIEVCGNCWPQIVAGYKALKHVMGRTEYYEPMELQDRLDKIGLNHVVWDPRLNKWVPANEILDETYKRFTDDVKCYGEYRISYCHAVAETEDEAKNLISHQMIDDGVGQRLCEWLIAERPVRECPLEYPIENRPPMKQMHLPF